MPKLAVLVSGGGTTLDNICECCAAGTLKAQVAVVVQSNNHSDHVIDKWRLKATLIPDGNSEAVLAACEGCDLIVSAGWIKLLKIKPEWKLKAINIHPSLLPKFGGKGFYGSRVHKAVLDAGEKVSGCTVHWMDEQYDHGLIIAQHEVAVMPGDTPETLQERVKAAERELYPKTIAAILGDFRKFTLQPKNLRYKETWQPRR